KDGVYTFRAQGGIYYLIGSLLPIDGILKFLQLYIYNTEFETANRLYVMPQFCNNSIEYAEHDIIVQLQSKGLIRISELRGSYDPMQYSLFFPQGDY
ncbi:23326_t:CDS:2, partial [Cetraspora pellucida]